MKQPLIGINLLYIRPNHVGGTMRYAFELLKYLAKLEQFRIKIYVQKGVLIDPELVALPKKEIKVMGGLLGRVTFEHVVLPIIAKLDGVDLLFSPGFVSPLWGRFLKVVTIHDLYYKRFPAFVRLWQRRYWQFFIPNSIRKSDAVITISDTTLRDICDEFPASIQKIKRIYLGADGGKSCTDVANWKDDPYCLVVGNMTPNKNIETIVSAFALLKQQGVPIRLVVAGSDLFGRLRAAIATVNEPLDVELLERVDDDVLATLYNKACCLIQASHYEGFGLPVAEAMVRGCPVIASLAPVLREVCNDAALYFPPDSPIDLVEAIHRYMMDERLREHHIALGKIRSTQFRWIVAAEETAQVFHTLLA